MGTLLTPSTHFCGAWSSGALPLLGSLGLPAGHATGILPRHSELTQDGPLLPLLLWKPLCRSPERGKGLSGFFFILFLYFRIYNTISA